MKIFKQNHEITTFMSGEETLKYLEKIGRVAYKSEDKITNDSAAEFIKKIIKSGHESVIEHAFASVKMTTSRGITHELVRHRIASYTQSSTRYIDSNKYGCEFILPHWITGNDEKALINYSNSNRNLWEDEMILTPSPDYKLKEDASLLWLEQMLAVENAYNILRMDNKTPQQARDILPNSTKTEIVMTTNFREWRHFFKLRTSKAAHPDMQLLTRPMLKVFQSLFPIIFDDITYES